MMRWKLSDRKPFFDWEWSDKSCVIVASTAVKENWNFKGFFATR